MKVLKRLFSSLNKDKIKYMVAGGVAVNLYGIERATADIDIILMLDDRNLSQFVKVAKKLALKPKMPVKIEDLIDPDKRKRWAKDKNMKVFGLYDEKIRFFLSISLSRCLLISVKSTVKESELNLRVR